ncbi:MAG: hypothetical protein OSB09_11335 [Planctomycetota bacterium]|nr:hypothetical protein [Planctomycetota bacterium]
MSRIHTYLAENEVLEDDPTVEIPFPRLAAPGDVPLAGAPNNDPYGGLMGWIIEDEMARGVDAELSDENTDLAGNIVYLSLLLRTILPAFVCASFVGAHKRGAMLLHVADPKDGEAVTWEQEQQANLLNAQRAISFYNFWGQCVAVWSVPAEEESGRLYFAMLASELAYEYSNNFPVEEWILYVHENNVSLSPKFKRSSFQQQLNQATDE